MWIEKCGPRTVDTADANGWIADETMIRNETPGRRSIRHAAFDYSTPGAYFITIVTRGRQTLLSHIVEGAVVLTDLGNVILAVWNTLPNRFPGVELDAFVIMPNHVHGIVWLTRDARDVGAGLALPGALEHHQNVERTAQSVDVTLMLGTVVGAFKSLSARAVNETAGRSGPLWHRNYFERIIRNERELTAVRQYILDNPANWALDAENIQRG